MPLYAFAVWMLLNPEVAPVLFISLSFYSAKARHNGAWLALCGLGCGAIGRVPHADDDPVCERKYVLSGLIVASAIVLVSEEVFNDRSASFVLSNFSWVIVTFCPLRPY